MQSFGLAWSRCNAVSIQAKIWRKGRSACGKPPARGADRLLAELFRSQYFCREEDGPPVRSGGADSRPSTERLACVAKRENVVILASLFERRAAGVYHNTAAVIGTDGEILGSTGRCTFPTILCTLRSSISLRGIWDSAASTHGSGASRRWSAGTSGIRRRRGSRRWVERRFCSTRRRFGWHPAEKEQYGAAQHDAWKTIQRGHAIANGVYVAASIGGLRRAAGARAGILGGSFVADPFGQLIAKPRTTRRRRGGRVRPGAQRRRAA